MSDIIKLKASELGVDEESEITIVAHVGEKAIDMANEITEMIGPVFLDLAAAMHVENSELAPMARQNAMAEAVKRLYVIIPKGALLPLAKRLFVNVSIAKKVGGEDKIFRLNDKADFNLYFQRNLKPLIPLMRRVIEFNGFFDVDLSGLVLETEREQTETTS